MRGLGITGIHSPILGAVEGEDVGVLTHVAVQMKRSNNREGTGELVIVGEPFSCGVCMCIAALA